MIRTRVLLAACCLLAVVSLTACGGRGTPSNELIVTGSTTILPIAEVAAEMYRTRFPEVDVLVSGVGSSAGIENVSTGTSDIGTSSRDLKPEEETLGLVDTPIAYDAIAVIVHPSNPIGALTTQQVKDIFQGKITNWRDVGGEDRPIHIVNRDEASGTREAFSKIVMDGDPFYPGAAVLPGTGQVRSVVADAAGGVGYISFGFVNDSVKALSVDGVYPSEETVFSGEYPLQRTLHFFTKGAPSGLAKRYTEYVLSGEVQDTVVREAGFIPMRQGEPQ